MDDNACKAVPLMEQLRSVPTDAVLRIDTPNALGCMDTRSIPVGRLCHEAAAALDAATTATPTGSAVVPQACAAWMHDEDSTRVISAAQKSNAMRDGGASASSVARYSIPLGRLDAFGSASGGSAVVPAGEEQAHKSKAGVGACVDPTDPGHDVLTLREHVRHLERRIRELHAERTAGAQACDRCGIDHAPGGCPDGVKGSRNG